MTILDRLLNNEPVPPQEIFDFVVAAILAQGRPSMAGSSPDPKCRYRGSQDAKCAVGHLIPDYIYDEYMEGKSVAHLVRGKDSPYAYLKPHVVLLELLQMAHDESALISSRNNEPFIPLFIEEVTTVAVNEGLFFDAKELTQ